MFAQSPRSSKRRAARPWLVLVVLWIAALPLAASERGLPLITVYSAEVHKAGPQTFDLAQDTRGVLYFGNLHGLVTFDGAWWRLRKLPDDQAPLAVATDSAGRVVLGMTNELGYLQNDAVGSPEYRSLLPLLPKNKRDFGDVRGVCSTAAGFLFVTETSLIVWNGTTARVAAEFDRESAPRGCYAGENEVYLRGPKGLHKFDPITARIEPAGIDGHVMLIVRAADGRIVAAVKNEGLFVVDNGTKTPWAPAATEWLKGKLVTGGCLLRDGRIAVTTRQHGLLILAKNGDIEQILNEAAGLPDAVINEARIDREGALWLAMEGPLVRIDLSSPVSVFDARKGLRGSAGDAARFAGRLYAISSHGLHVIAEDGSANRIDEIVDTPWRMLPLADEMLVGTTRGIDSIDKNGKIAHVADTSEVYDVVRSISDASRVWLAERGGVGSIHRVNGKWTYEGLVPGTPQYISTVVEHDGVLWAGTVFNGILRIENARGAKPRIQQFGENEMNAFLVNGRVVLVKANGQILQPDGEGRLIPDPILGHISAPRGFFVVAADASGNIWINSLPPRMFARQSDGSYAREGRPLVSVSAADIQNLRTHGNVVWFASDKGLFRYEPLAASETTALQPTPLIRRVIAGENRLLFGGVATGGKRAQLQHNFGRIRIEFAPASYRPGVSYQYRLDPIDTQWSEWTDQTFIDYTTLSANDYTFRLRARGPAMVTSEETAWKFSVSPPWYLEKWAYALWALLIIAAIAGVIRMRTSALERQAGRLRETVAERTTELRNTVKLLEEANTQLEALSLEDDLTGIANRRSFERALVDEWNRARRREHPLALILIDLDHFKDLNDRRGHPAGDDCLRRVGAFLAETVRRSGEVVARFGGEEFAILLPGTDADGAIRVAEALREGVEHLGVPYGGAKDRRVTASCGVAALTPTPQLAPESLVASADRALYAAKHSGRNCVRVADETTTGTWLRDVSA